MILAKRVLLITPELQYTGALQSFRRMCIVLKKNHFFVDVWSYLDGPYIEEFYKIGINVRIVKECDIDYDLINKEVVKYNLVIANTVCTYKIADLAKELVPVIWYIREAENLPDFFWKKEREWALKNAYKLYSVSEYAKDFIVNNYNKNVFVVHNFVDDVFPECGYLKEHRKNDKIRFVSLGTIEKRKGYDTLINAFLQLPEKIRENCELHIAGRLWDGARDFYPEILRKVNANANIFYHGEIREREKIHSLISSCDFVVVPSIDESCSLVALEGAMLARPLILSENIGAKYILDDKCGWTFKTGNVDSLCNTLIKAIECISDIKEMGSNARKRYLETSTFKIYEHNILAMVDENIITKPYLYQIKKHDIKLCSFDIFDTLITRKVSDPTGIFMIMQEKMKNKNYSCIPLVVRSNFVNIRTSNEKFMYRHVCDAFKQDINIFEIYNLIGENYGLTEEQRELLINLEIETEMENIIPINYNIDLIKNLLKQNKRVILISDMYFSQEIIRKFLVSIDTCFTNIPIYVSCEYNAKKNSGNLFKKVKEVENISFTKWLHCGDNFIGDYKSPFKLGIKTNIFLAEQLKEYEEILLYSYTDNLQYQKIIGLIKSIRYNRGVDELETLGISMGGPILFSYVYWLVNNAQERGIQNLYFIARDGYVLKKIADIIIEVKCYNINTSYLYGSRIAWKAPVLEKKYEKLDLISKYLKQNMDFSKLFAFVEFAGTGVTQDCLVKIMNTIDYDINNFKGSYFLYHSRNSAEQNSKKYSMLRLNELFNPFIELFVRAPHGQTLGYMEDINQNIIPSLDSLEGEALVNFGYDRYIRGVEIYTRSLLDLAEKDKTINLTDYTIALKYIRYLKEENISSALANVLGSIPFVLDGIVANVTEYAPPLTETDIKYIKNGQRNKIKTNNLRWSILRSTERIQKMLDTNSMSKAKMYDREEYLLKELDAVKGSRSYKLGRIITFLPRKVRGGIRCYKQHGSAYTFKRVLEHLQLKK